MKRLVAVVDYGMGNLRSVSQAVRRVASEDEAGACEVLVTSDPETVRRAERVVLPGQGAIADCMRELRDSGLEAAVREAAATKPLFGVCVGMQMLLESSEEGGGTAALGLFAGDVVRFRLEGRLQPDGSRFKVPQMGWNAVRQEQPHALWEGIPDEARFYFVHSFHARVADPADAAGSTEYGERFASAIARDNIFATQFHPEKSAANGLALYRNFLRWTP